MLRELNVVEQRYRAVLEVLSGIPVTEVAERYGVARQTVQSIEDAQAAVDAWRQEYNADRPHQSLAMAFPATRFAPATDGPVAHILSGGTVVRTVSCPVPEQARARLRGARAGTTGPPRLPESLQSGGGYLSAAPS